MNVQIVEFNNKTGEIELACITDNMGTDWVFCASGLFGDWMRTLDVVYDNWNDREDGSGYYFPTIDEALMFLQME